MKTMSLEKIDTVRKLSVDTFDVDINDQDSDQLVSPFEGRFYIKFADNQYKTFDQVVDAEKREEVVKKQSDSEVKSSSVKNDVVMVDYAGKKSEEESEEDLARLEGVIVDLFNDVTDLNRNQLELDEITDSDLYGDDC